MGIWHTAFPILQRYIPAHRNKKSLRLLDKIATTYHLMYENGNYDCENNGELFLLKALSQCNNLHTVFDVGANVGDYSLIARRINGNCRIIAFEPVPNTYRLLKDNTVKSNIEANNCALGSISGTSTIAVPEDSALASLLDYKQTCAGRTSENIEIDILTGKEFIINHPDIKEISLLKIDTEGYEPEVLKGFGDFASMANVIQFEYGKANLFSKYFLHDYFKDYSSEFYIGKLYPKGVRFYEQYNWDLDDLIGPNFVMVNKKRSDLVPLLLCQ